jgi:hypothetical protein
MIFHLIRFLISDESEDETENDSNDNAITFYEENDGEDGYEIFEGKYKDALIYTRKIFKYFRKSPVKLSQLRNAISSDLELNSRALPLDVRTRWNSILPMVQRYLEIKKQIESTLKQFNDGRFFESQHDKALEELAVALEPVRNGVLKLSEHNSNLLIAEATMIYIVNRLKSAPTRLSKDLGESMLQRYNSRRNKETISLLLTLQRHSFPKSIKDFEYSSKPVIKKTALDLYERLYPNVEEGSEEESNLGIPSDNLDAGISSIMAPAARVTGKSLDKDFALLEANGERSIKLEKLYQALMSIKPTSTVCEQTFSVAGAFKTKIRNRLSPKKLNTLVWLKTFFAKMYKK